MSSLDPNPPPTAGTTTRTVLGHAGDDRHEDLEEVRHLRGRVDRVVAAERLRDHAHAARLHRHRDQALLEVALLHRVCGGREHAIDRVGIRNQAHVYSGSCRDRRGRGSVGGRPRGRARPGAPRIRPPPVRPRPRLAVRSRRARSPRRRRRNGPRRARAASDPDASCPRSRATRREAARRSRRPGRGR